MNKYFLIISLLLTQVFLVAVDATGSVEEKKKAACQALLAHSKNRYYREKVRTLVNNLDGADNAYRSLNRRFRLEYNAREKLRGDYEISYDQLFKALSTIHEINNAAKNATNLELTKRVYTIIVDVLEKHRHDVRYMHIEDMDKSFKDPKTDFVVTPFGLQTGLAIEVENLDYCRSFYVYLHSRFGILNVASGGDSLYIDFAKTSLKVSAPHVSFDYGEVTKSWPIDGIQEE